VEIIIAMYKIEGSDCLAGCSTDLW